MVSLVEVMASQTDAAVHAAGAAAKAAFATAANGAHDYSLQGDVEEETKATVAQAWTVLTAALQIVEAFRMVSWRAIQLVVKWVLLNPHVLIVVLIWVGVVLIRR